MNLKRRLEVLETRDGTSTLGECLAFVDQLGRDFPDIAPTSQEARQRMAEGVQRLGGPLAYMRNFLAEIDGETAHL
ncbi:hypothetical protein [Solidesulfovibrio alcoholivorans]|uniref:hypothetical protein n=1 Tax=Solidesulfovibrio alcoholivorans TaxID=81406 RepID=UPI000495B3F0|nr:hypothetical protein [Solidesulfovibrio alcoholivorans]